MIIAADISPLQSAAKVSGWYLRPERDLGLCSVVSYYAEHDHYRVMDCQGMMMVTPVIMGTSAEPVIEWKKIYNIEKSFLSQTGLKFEEFQ